jgi:hypothetical protein
MVEPTREQLITRLFNYKANIKDDVDALNLMYTADARLAPLLKKMDALVKLKAQGCLSAKEQQELGYMLETVAVLVFQELPAITSFKSFRSPSAQYDLLVKGAGTPWIRLCEMLSLDKVGGIFVEAKATAGKVDDAQFQRAGSILAHHLRRSARLGIFLTLEGATGFPAPGETSAKVHSARLTQVVIYHSIKKPVVVLDWSDIKQLTKPGSLIEILERKIREIEEQTGRAPQPSSEPVSCVLPEHMQAVCRFKST